ncbi:MAG: aminotransferase class I/II-fold pyridoxal phosphate-dependent enzyme [Xanthobacteraceae bacterium]|nr:aminotransferase class I/II-fold pyridoxal phosphate-dependent enzyme [Xanthobacteraceae bacterium]
MERGRWVRATSAGIGFCDCTGTETMTLVLPTALRSGKKTSAVSVRTQLADAAFAAVRDFYVSSRYAQHRNDPDICDFTFGNPHEMPLAGVVSAIREHAAPHDKNWFAYKTSEPEPRTFLADRVGRELGLAFEPSDFALTAGAFAAIMVAFHLMLDRGDEVVFSEPAWFCYEPMLLAADLTPRKVRLKGPEFDLDLDAIEKAIGPKTRLVIVNTPHNPTGRIYGRDTLEALADLLERASARFGRRIFLLSDEPYRRLRFDGRGFVSPAAVYPWTLISYSYGKVLLAPGQRVGYLALSPLMPLSDRQALRDAMFSAQMALGWCFPNAVMQYALPDLEELSIDRAALARRRDQLTATLAHAGFDVLRPEGTFYLWSKWPAGDPERHWNRLADRKVFVMPGSIMGAPPYLRISLTASDRMIELALPAFAALAAA